MAQRSRGSRSVVATLIQDKSKKQDYGAFQVGVAEEKVTVDVFLTKTGFELVVTLNGLQWHSETNAAQIGYFHKQIGREFPGIKVTLPEKIDFKKDLPALKGFLERSLNHKSVRESVSCIKLIGISTPITADIPEYMRTYQENWKAPLVELDAETKFNIGKIIIFFYKSWSSNALHRYFPKYDESYCKENGISRASKTHAKYIEKILKAIFERLELTKPQSDSLLALADSSDSVPIPIEHNLVKLRSLDEKFKWAIVWEMLLQSLIQKDLDSRIHVSVQTCAALLGLSLEDLSIAEQECAAILQRQLIEMRKIEEKNESKNRIAKIVGGAALGGGVMFIAGLIVLPLLLPILVAGFGLGAAAAAAVPVAGAAVAAGVSAAGAVAISASVALPFIFGALGAGLVGSKVANVTEGLDEFHFVRVPIDQDSDDDDQPEERYIIDWQRKMITDTHTGETYPATGKDLDFNQLVKMVNNASSKSGHLENTPENAALAKKEKKEKKDREKQLKKEKEEREKQLKKERKEKEEEENQLTPEEEESIQSAGMEVVIGVNGWLWKEKHVTKNFAPIRDLHPGAELYSLQWQTEQLITLGKFIVAFVTDQAVSYVVEAIICAVSTTAAAVLAALAIPLYILLAAVLIDNPWTLVSNHAKRAGKILAKVIIARECGNRPVTLVGWSHGARVIFSALEYINKLDNQDHRGIIQNVYLIGSTVTSRPERWEAVRPLVAGRMVNCYSKSDWFLPIIHRITTAKSKAVSGITEINVPTVENIDVTEIVGGHLNYSKRLKKIFKLLHMTNSAPEAFAHRTKDEALYNKLTDKALKDLCDKTKLVEDMEKATRKAEAKEKSITGKLTNKFSRSKNEVKEISGPIGIVKSSSNPGYRSLQTPTDTAPPPPSQSKPNFGGSGSGGGFGGAAANNAKPKPWKSTSTGVATNTNPNSPLVNKRGGPSIGKAQSSTGIVRTGSPSRGGRGGPGTPVNTHVPGRTPSPAGSSNFTTARGSPSLANRGATPLRGAPVRGSPVGSHPQVNTPPPFRFSPSGSGTNQRGGGGAKSGPSSKPAPVRPGLSNNRSPGGFANVNNASPKIAKPKTPQSPSNGPKPAKSIGNNPFLQNDRK